MRVSEKGRAQLAAAKRARRGASDASLIARTVHFAASMLRVGEYDNLKDAIRNAAQYSLDGVGGARKVRLMRALAA